MSSADGARRSRKPLIATLAALLVIAGGYVGGAAFLGQRVPAHATVAGVPVGGKTPEAAEAAVRSATKDRAADPVTMRAESATATLDPAKSGLSVNFPATMAGLTGFSLDPRDLWSHLTGSVDRPLVTDVDEAKLTDAVKKAAAPLEIAVAEGSISLAGGVVTVKQPVIGRTVDAAKTAQTIAKAWPTTAPISATTTDVQPTVSADEIARVKTEFADKAMSGPVTVVVGDKSVALTPKTLGSAITLAADDKGTITPAYDEAKLVAAVHAAATEAGIERRARDAEAVFEGGQPTVRPSATGVAISDDGLAKAIVAALTGTSRTVTATTTTTQPKLTTEQVKATLPKEQISTFTTYYGYAPGRVDNIKLAARTLNGTYVAPGATFSLNGVLGQRTAAKGYHEAPVIMYGRLTKDYGGGISQVSTTTFNAAFFSGMKFLEYTPHAFYISRYPEGREATISWPNVDQKWVNATDGGVLIQATATDSSITVSFYGTKKWEITATKGPRRNIVQPKKIVDNKPTCVPQAPSVGFDVTVGRIFSQNGRQVRTESFNTHYIPEDDVTCTHPKAG
jgi:vancomycin resistance protein YoaR